MSILSRKSVLNSVKIGGLIIFILFLLFPSYDMSLACTFVIKANDKAVIVGYNEDSIEPRTKIWFYPLLK